MYFNMEYGCEDCGCSFEKPNSPCGSGGSRCPRCGSGSIYPLVSEKAREVNGTLSLGLAPVNKKV